MENRDGRDYYALDDIFDAMHGFMNSLVADTKNVYKKGISLVNTPRSPETRFNVPFTGLIKQERIVPTETGVKVEIALPGYKKDDIDVSIKDDILTVSAERKVEYENKGEDGEVFYRQVTESSYSKAFNISSYKHGGEDIKVSLLDGILSITLETAKPEEPVDDGAVHINID